ncbi:hypothetical protein BDAP_001947 [Binucleata daphniae]
MGKNENETRSGKKIENLLKAEKVVENKTSNVAESAVVVEVVTPTSKESSLLSVLQAVDAPQENWPKEAFRAVILRFGRMPRSGWNTTYTTFCEMFAAQTSFATFKKEAQQSIVTSTGKNAVQESLRKTWL